jgi:Coenzyme PQQ synthesis protein D (PqqD)
MYKVNTAKILFTQLGNEGVILDIEKNEYVTLNETFFKILHGLEQEKSSEQLCETLCKEYEITQEACLKEIEIAISELIKKQFIYEA